MEDREILEEFCKNPIGVNYSETKQAISNILKENENLKQAIKINHDLYETKCNENKELTDDLTSVYISGVYDERSKWQSKVKEEIEKLKSYKGLVIYEKYNYEVIINFLQDLLGEEK